MKERKKRGYGHCKVKLIQYLNSPFFYNKYLNSPKTDLNTKKKKWCKLFRC